MRALTVSCIFIFMSSVTYSQMVGFDEIADSAVSKWTAKEALEYEGIYYFGISEAESHLLVIVGQNGVTGQIKSGQWAEEGMEWLWHFENLRNIKIEDGKLTSDQYSGEFVELIYNGESKKGLKINNPWTPGMQAGIYEVGLKGERGGYYSGDFSQASERLLNQDELLALTKEELQIMRNAIFARYGYRFKPGGRMAEYFGSKDWYQAQYLNVTDFLTDIELANIELIRRIENEK